MHSPLARPHGFVMSSTSHREYHDGELRSHHGSHPTDLRLHQLPHPQEEMRQGDAIMQLLRPVRELHHDQEPQTNIPNRKKLDCQYPSAEGKYIQSQPKPLVAAPSPLISSALLLSATLSEALVSQPTNVDSTIYLQVLRIIRSAGQTVEDATARYFRGVHSFIPIVSRSRFQNTLADLSQPPPASFSVLLLSICLITYHPELAPTPTSTEPISLYSATKSFFTQVQASLPLSLNLIQAGVIIATYEFFTGRIHDAFASISTCARLGYAARLHLAILIHEHEAAISPETEENANTWWGIMICER